MDANGLTWMPCRGCMARITQEVINVFRSKFNVYGTITAILGPLRHAHIISDLVNTFYR